MRRFRVVSLVVLIVLGVMAFPPSSQAGHIYGGYDSNHVLVPWFVVDQKKQDVRVTITNLDTSLPNTFPNTGPHIATFVKIGLWTAGGVLACSSTAPLVAEAQRNDSIRALVNTICSNAGRALLDAGDDTFRGFATYELQADNTGTNERDNDFGLVGTITVIGGGVVRGFNAPGYFDAAPSGLNAFSLLSAEQTFVHFHVAVDGKRSKTPARIVIWSAKTGGCGTAVDSACVDGVAGGGQLRVCDDNGTCSAQPLPSLTQAVNFFSAGNIVPATFATDGGWFVLRNDPVLSTGNTLSVLVYADDTVAPKSTKGAVVFPAPREISQ